MGHEVYANGRAISCKAAAGKSICAFPDTCLSPPSPPAGPIPVPYPNTAFSSDTTSGSKKVKMSNKEVMLKNTSYFKKSTGDEAATKSLGMGVVSHQIQGKVYFTSWSMDVKVEGKNVVRHFDLTTHNHMSPTPNGPPWLHTDAMAVAFGPGGKCEGMEHLKLQPYSQKCPPGKDGSDQTGHHLIPGRCMKNNPDYSHSQAPVICVSKGNQHQGSHKLCHAKFDPVEHDHHEKGKELSYQSARKTAASSAGGALDPPRELEEKEQGCVEFQLDQYYKGKPPKGAGCADSTPMRTSGKPGKVIPPSTAPSGTY